MADAEYLQKVEAQIKEMPSMENCRTSLADINRIFKPTFAVVSSPETGLNGMPVMTVAESIPKELKEGIKWTNLVDFAGSTSGEICKQAVEHADGKGDFGHSAGPPSATDIKNSFWCLYWRGKVGGGLTSSLINMSPTQKENNWGSEQLGAHAPYFVTEGTYRMVVIVTIDGGPITQVEKSLIPTIMKNVIGDLNRRKYSWVLGVRLVWTHFKTIEDMVQSLEGVRTLTVDYDFQGEFHYEDDQYKPVVYKHVDADAQASPVANPSMLTKSGSEILEEARVGAAVNMQGLMMALVACDRDAVEFIIKKAPDFLKINLDEQDGNGLKPLHAASCVACANDVNASMCRALLQLRAEINAVCAAGRHGDGTHDLGIEGDVTPIKIAVAHKRADAVAALLEYKADIGMIEDDACSIQNFLELKDIPPELHYKEYWLNKMRGIVDTVALLRSAKGL